MRLRWAAVVDKETTAVAATGRGQPCRHTTNRGNLVLQWQWAMDGEIALHSCFVLIVVLRNNDDVIGAWRLAALSKKALSSSPWSQVSPGSLGHHRYGRSERGRENDDAPTLAVSHYLSIHTMIHKVVLKADFVTRP